MSFKEKVYQHCLSLVAERSETLQSALNDIAVSIGNETKSTAGDKYETARAMLHIEQENVTRQLLVVKEQRSLLERIDRGAGTGRATTGSLIRTDKGYFFLSIALSRITVDGIPVIALSPESPLGKSFLGCAAQDIVEFNIASYHIQSVE